MIYTQSRAFPVGMICVAIALMIASTSRGEPAPDLNQTGVWFDMAVGDSAGIKREKDELVQFAARLGMARCNAGDTTGAVAIADELMHGSGNAPTPVCGVFDQLSAAAIYDAAGHPEMARKILEPLEKKMIARTPRANEVRMVTPESIPEDNVMENIVIRYAIMGENKHAAELADKIWMTMTRQNARCELAHQLFIRDHKDEAKHQLDLVLEDANRESYDADRSQMFDEASREFSQEAEFNSAFKYAMMAKDSYRKMQSLTTVIVAMYRTGDVAGSREKAVQVWKLLATGPATERFDGLHYLAVEQLDEAGDVPGAAKTVTQLEGLPPGELKPSQQQQLLYLKARVAAALGDVAECHRQVEAAKSVVVPDAGKADSPWSEPAIEMGYIARAFSAAGKFDEALTAANDAGNWDGYDYVIVGMANHGMLAQAITLLPKIDSPVIRGVDSEKIAEQGIKSGKRADVYDWIKSIHDKRDRTRAELGACEGLAKTKRSLEIVDPPLSFGLDGN